MADVTIGIRRQIVQHSLGFRDNQDVAMFDQRGAEARSSAPAGRRMEEEEN